MTKEETKKIQVGSKVYIWGNKEKAQKVIWKGLGTLGTGSPRDIRFETGMYFSLNDPSQIEFAPEEVETETADKGLMKISVRNGYSLEFIDLEVPVNNYLNERNFYFTSNKIETDNYGCLVTYNMDLINSAKKE